MAHATYLTQGGMRSVEKHARMANTEYAQPAFSFTPSIALSYYCHY